MRVLLVKPTGYISEDVGWLRGEQTNIAFSGDGRDDRVRNRLASIKVQT